MQACACAIQPTSVRGFAHDAPWRSIERLAAKVGDPSRWPAVFDDVPYRIEYLVRSRGGLSDEGCRWHGCGKPCVNGLAFCPAHAYYESGLRQQV